MLPQIGSFVGGRNVAGKARRYRAGSFSPQRCSRELFEQGDDDDLANKIMTVVDLSDDVDCLSGSKRRVAAAQGGLFTNEITV